MACAIRMVMYKFLNWRNIPIALKIPEKGEGKAHACANACFRQLSKTKDRMAYLA